MKHSDGCNGLAVDILAARDGLGRGRAVRKNVCGRIWVSRTRRSTMCDGQNLVCGGCAAALRTPVFAGAVRRRLFELREGFVGAAQDGSEKRTVGTRVPRHREHKGFGTSWWRPL